MNKNQKALFNIVETVGDTFLNNNDKKSLYEQVRDHIDPREHLEHNEWKAFIKTNPREDHEKEIFRRQEEAGIS